MFIASTNFFFRVMTKKAVKKKSTKCIDICNFINGRNNILPVLLNALFPSSVRPCRLWPAFFGISRYHRLLFCLSENHTLCFLHKNQPQHIRFQKQYSKRKTELPRQRFFSLKVIAENALQEGSAEDCCHISQNSNDRRDSHRMSI